LPDGTEEKCKKGAAGSPEGIGKKKVIRGGDEPLKEIKLPSIPGAKPDATVVRRRLGGGQGEKKKRRRKFLRQTRSKGGGATP